jgi:hypothetical protein
MVNAGILMASVGITEKPTAENIPKALQDASSGFDLCRALLDPKNNDTIIAIAEKIAESLVPLAMCICALFFIIALVELGASERMNLEIFMKFFIKLALGILLINSTPNLIELGQAFDSTAQTAIDSAFQKDSGTKTKDNTDYSAIASEYAGDDKGFFDYVTFWLSIKFGKLLSFFVSLMIGAIIITRMFEIAIRGAFMPLPMGFVTEEGTRAGAFRYLKQYIAVWLQGPAMKILFALQPAISAAVATTCSNSMPVGLSFLAALFAQFLVAVGLLGACKATKPVMENALGV